MEFLKKPRLVWARAKIRRRLRKTYRNKKFNNLRNSHKIGIIWDGSYQESFGEINSFYQKMKANGIQVDIICYYPGDILPDQYTALRYLKCFKRTDLNFFYIPKLDELEDFIGTPYEVLIDINFKNRFPLYYITALSKAEFKIGASKSIDHEALDMTLELNDNSDIRYYLEQVEHYLNMINTSI